MEKTLPRRCVHGALMIDRDEVWYYSNVFYGKRYESDDPEFNGLVMISRADLARGAMTVFKKDRAEYECWLSVCSEKGNLAYHDVRDGIRELDGNGGFRVPLACLEEICEQLCEKDEALICYLIIMCNYGEKQRHTCCFIVN